MTTMTKETKHYLQLLDDRGRTCILLKDKEVIYESDSLGVKPLRLLRMDNFQKEKGAQLVLIDKVIGKGALMLAELLGVDEIHTPLASEKALSYSQQVRIPLYYETLVPFIENRDRSGMCPIENAVKDTQDPNLGEKNIEAAIEILMRG